MKLKPERIHALMSEAKMGPAELARRVGRSQGWVRHLRDGRTKSIDYPEALRVAKALNSPVNELFDEEPGDDLSAGSGAPIAGAKRALSAGPILLVRYTVQAGHWVEVDQQTQERIESPPVAADPRYPRDAQWVELVRGDSADLYYPEGAFVHVVDAVAIEYAPREGDFVIVERKREQGGLIERSLKQVTIGPRRRIELWPRSRNPKWNAPLKLQKPPEDNHYDADRIAAVVIGGYLPARRP